MSEHDRYRLLARAILMDYGVPPALAVACGEALILNDHSELERLCREAWGEERLRKVVCARGETE